MTGAFNECLVKIRQEGGGAQPDKGLGFLGSHRVTESQRHKSRIVEKYWDFLYYLFENSGLNIEGKMQIAKCK
jgi:hypothetical protein